MSREETPKAVTVNWAKWNAQERVSIRERIYRWLGQFDGFYTKPPLDERKRYFGEDLIKFNNDGFEVWFGTANQWHCFYRHDQFRRMVAWYLWQVTVVDWFGLRTWIWYKLLHRRVNRHRAAHEEKPLGDGGKNG